MAIDGLFGLQCTKHSSQADRIGALSQLRSSSSNSSTGGGDLCGLDRSCKPLRKRCTEILTLLGMALCTAPCFSVQTAAAEYCALALHDTASRPDQVDRRGSSRSHQAAAQRAPRAATATCPLRLTPAACRPCHRGLEPLPPRAPKPVREGCEPAGRPTPERQRYMPPSPSTAQAGRCFGWPPCGLGASNPCTFLKCHGLLPVTPFVWLHAHCLLQESNTHVPYLGGRVGEEVRWAGGGELARNVAYPAGLHPTQFQGDSGEGGAVCGVGCPAPVQQLLQGGGQFGRRQGPQPLPHHRRCQLLPAPLEQRSRPRRHWMRPTATTQLDTVILSEH